MPRIDDRDALARSPAHALALDCLAAGIDAARPELVVAEHVRLADDTLHVADASYDLAASDEIVVLGGGKAADGVAAALETVLDDRLDGGLVVTDDGERGDGERGDDASAPTPQRVTVHRASHPLPDERGQAAAERVLERARDAGEETLVIAVVTGGASALLPAPAGDLTVEALRETTDALLSAGVPIDELNAVRKHCSAIKGGRLAAAAAPATVVTLALSDVVGDDPATIGSGPTVPDPTTYADCLAVLDRADGAVPDTVRAHLTAGERGLHPETPAPDDGDDRDDGVVDDENYHVLANAWTAVDAARQVASERGYRPLVLSTRIQGEASEQGRAHAATASEVRASGNPVEPPAVLLSAGETTVTVTGDGEGGPNLAFALAAALDLPEGAVLGAVDTDGRDGGTDAAGALVDAETVPDAETRRETRRALADDNALNFLRGRDAVVRTGATGTNVDDLRVLVVP
jgi:glycerate 2-kinase